MSTPRVTVTLTDAQARAVIHALAYCTAGSSEDAAWPSHSAMLAGERALRLMHDARREAAR